MTAPIGLFGGTFDPIHLGHLRLAEELGEVLGCIEVRFIPTGTPPHRAKPIAGPLQRRDMVAAAILDNPRFVLDAREVMRDDPCYAVDTLAAIRADVGAAIPLVFFIGSDAFLDLPRWHRWTELFDLAHIAVAHRPGFLLNPAEMPEALYALPWARMTECAEDLHTMPAGKLFFHAVTPLDIAARRIRAACADGASVRYLVTEAVFEYIKQNQLYR